MLELHPNRTIKLFALLYSLTATSAVFAAGDYGSGITLENPTNQEQDVENAKEKRKTIGEHFLSLNPFKKKEEEPAEEGGALFEEDPEYHRDTSRHIDRKHNVEDLAYGEILLPYFTNNNYQALVEARIAQDTNRLKRNKEHAALLLAQLYIIEGLPQAAEKTLQQIAKEDVSRETRSAALFQLVRIYTYQGKLEEAKKVLEQGFPPLKGHLELERKVLLANIYSKQKNKEAVKHTLIDVTPEITRNAYIKYNLASSGFFAGEEDFALPLLLQLTEGQHNDLESRTLKDYANLSAGIYYLKKDELENAKTHFKAVSYIGPHSSAALYYVAWIELKQENLKTAFAYWVDLSKRNPTDPFVGKSFLIRPYTLEKLESTHLSLSGYMRAVELYNHLISDIDSTIEIINSPEWIKKLHPGSLETISMHEKIRKQPGWIDTQTNEINFLIDLYSSDDFAVMHQNFWELELLMQDLQSKRKKFEIFLLQRDTHDEKYERLVPEAKAEINSRRLQSIRERLADISSEMQEVTEKKNTLAAPSQEQLGRLNRIKRLKAVLEKEPSDMYLTQRRYLSYLEKVNAWDMTQDAPSRQWKIKEQHRELSILLAQTEKHIEQIKLGMSQADYYEKIMPKLNYLSSLVEIRTKELELLSLKHQVVMRERAVEILKARKKEYQTLSIRAKLAAARLQDSIVTGGKK